VGNDNARKILRRIGLNHGFTKPVGFVGGICFLWPLYANNFRSEGNFYFYYIEEHTDFNSNVTIMKCSHIVYCLF